MPNQVLHVIRRAKVRHCARKIDCVVHRISLFSKVKRYCADLLGFLEDPLLRADFLQSLDVLKDRVYDLFLIGESLFGQRDIDIEITNAVIVVVCVRAKLHRIVFRLEIA